MAKTSEQYGVRILSVLAIVSMGVAFAVTNASAQQYPPSMVSYWKFDEGSGTIAYDSIGTNHGTIYGATWTTGQVDRALSFDGEDDYVDIPDNNLVRNRSALTISVWFKIAPSETKFKWLFEKTHASSGFSLESPWRLSPNFDVDNTLAGSVATLLTETWYHAALTLDGSTARTYLNGAEVDSRYFSTSVPDNSDPIIIGRRISGYEAAAFKGIIDEVAIYNRALSACEIMQYYRAGLIGLGYEVRVKPADVLRTLRMKFSEELRKKLSRLVEQMHKKADGLERQADQMECWD